MSDNPSPNEPSKMVDRFGRRITYLRLSVTDRCTLRCTYCMPEEGASLLPKSEILTWEEMERLVGILVKLGIRKIRITGGEPFTRKGIMDFLRSIRKVKALREIHVTTNGFRAAPFIPSLREVLDGINLSLDTLDRNRFRMLTRRDGFEEVMAAFRAIVEFGIPLKINTVVTAETSCGELIDMAGLAERLPIEVRFIEEMPFLSGKVSRSGAPDAARIRSVLESRFDLIPMERDNATAMRFKIPGFTGGVGIIAGNSRLFCSRCNRIRITPSGFLKTCLYGRGVLNLKEMIRKGKDDEEISRAVIASILEKERDGFEACAGRGDEASESMAGIGG